MESYSIGFFRFCMFEIFHSKNKVECILSNYVCSGWGGEGWLHRKLGKAK
jgi:hypothetical protein